MHDVPESRTGSPDRAIVALGGMWAASLSAYALLSWGLNLVKPLSVSDQRLDFYRRVTESIPGAGPALLARLEGFDPLSRPGVFLTAYVTPVLLATAAFVGLVAVLARRRGDLTTSSVRRVLAFGIAGACICALALPVLADDFWLSVVWGRMIASGVNAYYVPMSEAFVGGTPFEVLNWRGNMTYGPVWAAVSAAVMGVAGGHPLAGAILFKALLASGWVACLLLVRAIVSDGSPWRQCMALAIFGWLPVGAMQGVADGHNDVLVTLFLLGWLWALRSERPLVASLSLAASVAVKYVTGLLFVLDFLHHVCVRRAPAIRYLPRGLVAAALFLAGVVPFHGLRGFFVHMTTMREWAYRFLTPREAVIGLERLTGFPLVPLRAVAVAAFPILAVWLIVRFVRAPDDDRFRLATLAVLLASLLGVIGYLWPWYILWPLAVAALIPGSPLSRFAVGLAVLLPFPVLLENAFPGGAPGTKALVPALVFYLAALLWLFVLPRRWFADSPETPVSP